MYKSGLQLYILTHNRPDFLELTIESVIKSGVKISNVLISDNSTNELTSELMHRKYPNIKYIRRNKLYSPIQHLNLILSESTHEYLMMFHDDDLLIQGSINNILNLFLRYPNLSAVGINSYIIHNNSINTKLKFFQSKSEILNFNCANSLLEKYASFLPRNIAPFPGYVYNMTKIKGVMFNENIAGRCSDVVFLFDILRLGDIAWISKPYMIYREHEFNGAKKITHKELKYLIRYFKRNKFEEILINKMRVKYLYYLLKNKNDFNLAKKLSIVITLIKLILICITNEKSTGNEIFTKLYLFINKKFY